MDRPEYSPSGDVCAQYGARPTISGRVTARLLQRCLENNDSKGQYGRINLVALRGQRIGYVNDFDMFLNYP